MLINREKALEAAINVRAANAGNFERSGAVWEAYDKAALDCHEALRALPVSDGVTGEMVAAAGKKWQSMCGYAGDIEKPMRAALESALGATVSDGWEDKSLDKLDAWRFNVMLECQGGDGKCVIGGAVLNLNDLLAILDFVSDRCPLPAPPTIE